MLLLHCQTPLSGDDFAHVNAEKTQMSNEEDDEDDDDDVDDEGVDHDVDENDFENDGC